MDSPNKYDVVVLGGGPGGYAAAIRAAQRGASVALIEGERVGGTCLNEGCIPTKSLLKSAELLNHIQEADAFGLLVSGVDVDFEIIQDRKQTVVDQLVDNVENIVEANGVTIYYGWGSAPSLEEINVESGEGEQTTLAAGNLIVATGSEVAMPPITGLDLPGVVDSTGLLANRVLPPRLAVIGGGVIGMEMASLYAAFGVDVQVIEMLPAILPGVDSEIVRRLGPSFRRRGIGINTGAMVSAIEAAGDLDDPFVEKRIHFERRGKAQELAAELVLVSTGRRPRLPQETLDHLGVEYDRQGIKVNQRMETNVDGVYAIGDCVGGILLAHLATAEGLVAAANATGASATIDYQAVPNCVYTFPEVAGVGLTEDEATKQEVAYEVTKFPFSANSRASIAGEIEGLVKLISEESTGRVLGVHMFGPQATELIHEGVLAVRYGMTTTELAETIHAHPTLFEVMGEAAQGATEGFIHLVRRRRSR